MGATQRRREMLKGSSHKGGSDRRIGQGRESSLGEESPGGGLRYGRDHGCRILGYKHMRGWVTRGLSVEKVCVFVENY